ENLLGQAHLKNISCKKDTADVSWLPAKHSKNFYRDSCSTRRFRLPQVGDSRQHFLLFRLVGCKPHSWKIALCLECWTHLQGKSLCTTCSSDQSYSTISMASWMVSRNC